MILYISKSTASLPGPSAQDLTGQVLKADLYSFAFGGCSDIWKARWKNSEVAVKVLKGPEDPGTRRRLLRETAVWSLVYHRNITPFLGISFDFDRPCTPCLVSPFYRHGNLKCYIKKQPNADKLVLITQAASALSYLHDLSIIHGDFKASNILINDDGEASIIDFGLSRILDTSGFTTKLASGTLRFMAPELIEVCVGEEDQSIPQVTEATDVWAFAMTVIEIVTESMPFSHLKRDGSVIHYVMTGGRPKREHCRQINDEIWMMLERCWDIDPNQRPSMATLSTFFTSQPSL